MSTMKPEKRDDGALLERARQVLEVEAAAIRELAARLDGEFERAVALMHGCTGRVVTAGMGKSGIICRKIASTLSSTGTPSFYLHPAEAVHGDIGMLTGDDVMLTVSNSGETEELVRMLPLVSRLGVRLVAMVGRDGSSLAREADVVLDISVSEEACPLGLAPTASTTAALAMGDALAMALCDLRGFSAEQFAERHPGGQLGKRFLRVRDLMHAGKRMPLVPEGAPLAEAIVEITSKGFGVTSVVDPAGRLSGVITDGDLRRWLERKRDHALEATAGEAMTRSPVTIDGGELAAGALEMMERHHITSLFIVDAVGRPEGIIHLHDLWRTQLF
jgi:arabinose-5-phosphate isomerase